MPANLIIDVDNAAFAEGLGFSEKLIVLVRKGFLFEKKQGGVSIEKDQEAI